MKRKIKIVHTLTIVAMAFSLIFSGQKAVFADDEPSITELSKEDEKKIEKKQSQFEKLEKKKEAFKKIIELKKKQGASIEKQVSIMDAEIGKIGTEITINENKIENLESDINGLSIKIKEKEKLIARQKKVLIELIRSYYEFNKRNFFVSFTGSVEYSAFRSDEDMVAQVGTKVSEMLSSIKSLKTGLENEKEEFKEKKNKTVDLKYQLEERDSYLESNKLRKKILLAETQGDEAKYQSRLKKVKEQQLSILREIEEIEYGKIGDVDFSKLPKTTSGYLSYPVKNIRITQKYGKTGFSKNYKSKKHNGVDFGIKYKKVYAAKSGKILATGNNGKWAYGKWVAIDHGDGLVTFYGHLSKVSVSKGEKIKAEEKIGTSGHTGYSTGPHLHFSVFAKNTFEVVESSIVKGLMIPTGSSINPMKYL